MPLVSKNFSDIITFTRASDATYFDSAGVLQTASTDVPRLDYDPSTLAAQGLLIEEARTNLQTYSEDLTSWTNISSTATVSATATTAPTGANTGNSIVEDNTTGFRKAYQSLTLSPSTGYTFSLFIKALPGSAQRYVRLALWDFALTNGYAYITCNPNTGVIEYTTTSSNATADGWGAVTTHPVTSCGNGWYRFAFTVTIGTATIMRSQISLNDTISGITGGSGGSQSYAGDGTSGVYVWGAQLEQGAFATSVIPTTTTALTRSADVASVNTLSPWFNAAEGTLFVASTQAVTGTAGQLCAIEAGDGTNDNLIQLATQFGTTNFQGLVNVSSVAQAAFISAASTALTNRALAYKVNDFAQSINGGAVSTDTSGTVPTITGFGVGARVNGTSQLNGYLRRITYYPRRLSNAELQAITS